MLNLADITVSFLKIYFAIILTQQVVLVNRKSSIYSTFKQIKSAEAQSRAQAYHDLFISSILIRFTVFANILDVFVIVLT